MSDAKKPVTEEKSAENEPAKTDSPPAKEKPAEKPTEEESAPPPAGHGLGNVPAKDIKTCPDCGTKYTAENKRHEAVCPAKKSK